MFATQKICYDIFLYFCAQMKFTVGQISKLLNGKVIGDINIEVNKLSKIEDGTKGSLSFLSNPKYTPFIYSTEASVIIVNNDFKAEKN